MNWALQSCFKRYTGFKVLSYLSEYMDGIFSFTPAWRAVLLVACVASVSLLFRSKERGTGVKDRAANGASKRTGRGWERKEGNACRQTAFPSFPSPSPLFHFLAFVLFLARPKPKIPFLGLSLLRNLTETLATQANLLEFTRLYSELGK